MRKQDSGADGIVRPIFVAIKMIIYYTYTSYKYLFPSKLLTIAESFAIVNPSIKQNFIRSHLRALYARMVNTGFNFV